jgi:predicted amidohydrolase
VFAGHSLIVDPWGEVVVEANEEESILFGTIPRIKITCQHFICIILDGDPQKLEFLYVLL